MATGNFCGNDYGLPIIGYWPNNDYDEIRECIAETCDIDAQDVSYQQVDEYLGLIELDDADYIRKLIDEYNNTPFRIELEAGYYTGFELIFQAPEWLDMLLTEPDYASMDYIEQLAIETGADINNWLDKRKRDYLDYSYATDASDYISQQGWRLINKQLYKIMQDVHGLIARLCADCGNLRVFGIAYRFSNGETGYSDITKEFIR